MSLFLKEAPGPWRATLISLAVSAPPNPTTDCIHSLLRDCSQSRHPPAGDLQSDTSYLHDASAANLRPNEYFSKEGNCGLLQCICRASLGNTELMVKCFGGAGTAKKKRVLTSWDKWLTRLLILMIRVARGKKKKKAHLKILVENSQTFENLQTV